MGSNGKKVLVALSGGVDSSTGAAMLLEAGYNCSAAFIITNNDYQQAQASTENISKKLGIKLYVLDMRNEFEQIIDYFCDEYAKGRTPNPCVICNRDIKFGRLWYFAQEINAEYLATGHYARVLKHNGQIGLYKALYESKDQSYALSMIRKDILPHVIFPMGDYSKDMTREIASKFDLGTQNKLDSQEICFIPDNDYISMLETLRPELVHQGKIVDRTGEIIGEHNGIHRFTIGQRRGLKVAMGRPYYVTKLDSENNMVTLGPKEELMHKNLQATGINWLMDEPKSTFSARVKIRYNDFGSSAQVYPSGNNAVIKFDEPKAAITPGQLAVFYVNENDKSRVIGGGWIESVSD
jgi:tRNA-specific 2-thiouridylase